MTYNARAYDAKVVQKKPVGYIFPGQILAAAYLTVPKGSQHVPEAMKLIAFAVSKQVNGSLSSYLPLGPSNKEVKPDPAMASELPSSHLNEPYAVFDDKWIAENAKMLEARYQAWKSSSP